MNEEQKKELNSIFPDFNDNIIRQIFNYCEFKCWQAKREEREIIIHELQKLPVWQFDSTPYLEEFIQELKTNQK